MTTITTAFFVLLGCIYLLPFNTLINLYDYYDKVIFRENTTAITPMTFITYLNSAFQASSLLLNLLVLFINLPTGGQCLSTIHALAVITSSLLLVLICVAGLLLEAKHYIYISCVLASLLSTSQSLFDTSTLLLASTNKNVLAYACGINLSGTAHASIYLLLLYIAGAGQNVKELNSIGPTYLAVTAAMVSLGLFARLLNSNNNNNNNRSITGGGAAAEQRRVDSTSLFYAIHVCINFTITLTVYPQLMLRPDMRPLFNGAAVYLNFNASALVGNLIAFFFPISSKLYLALGLGVRALICVLYFFILTHLHVNIIFHVCTISFAGLSSAYRASCDFFGANLLANKTHALRIVNVGLSLGLMTGSLIAYATVYLRPW